MLFRSVLRRGVKFHDSDVFPGGKGREVKAADFVYSFKRILDAATASTGGWIFRGKVLEKPDGSPSDTCFVAANDSTLRIHLKEPFVPFLGILTMPYAYVVPHEAVDKVGRHHFAALAAGENLTIVKPNAAPQHEIIRAAIGRNRECAGQRRAGQQGRIELQQATI